MDIQLNGKKRFKGYLRLIVSEMGRSGRYEVKKIIDNILVKL